MPKLFILTNDLYNILGYCFNQYVLIDKNNILVDKYNFSMFIEQLLDILMQELQTQKIYISAKPKKLAKLLKTANYGDWLSNYTGDFFTIDNGSMTNPSSYMYQSPLGLLFPDFQNNYINRKDRVYGPNIDRTWKFIEPNDHAEWLMRRNNG